MNSTQNEVLKQVEELLSEMSLEQKVAQLQCMMVGMEPVKATMDRFPNGLGTVTAFGGKPSAKENMELVTQLQDAAKAHSDIPPLVHGEAVTGLNGAEAAIFPSAIGLGATWNPDTVEEMADVIRKQMISIGIRHALSPVMDVARDPRWGRVGETYGEDPTLCARMSVAFTKGLQGENLKDGVAATGKHFLGYGMGEGGLNMAANPIPPRELREVYGKPFQAAITEAGLESIMNSYGSIDGELVISSENILTDLLRGEMGFDGMVVSDYMSINKAVDLGISKDPAQGGIDALKAGLDVEMPVPYGYTGSLIEAVQSGAISESLVDRSVRKVLAAKIKLGILENPYPREDLFAEAYDRSKTDISSLKAARESIVLLKNEGLLPLDKEEKKIALIGPHGDSLRLLFSCYTYPAALDMNISGSMKDMAGMEDTARQDGKTAQKAVCYMGSTVRKESEEVTDILKKLYGSITPTIYKSICKKSQKAKVIYEKGCEIAGTDKSGFARAVELAKNADIVIVTLGGKYGWGMNSTTGEGVDTDKIGLPGVQEELAQAIYETGTPAIMVHMDAKPLSSPFITKNYPVIIENWFPGITGGQALADVLFGDYNPAGRLPMTAAMTEGQIPIYASVRNGSGYAKSKGMVLCRYVEGEKEPLHYFGEGLSYTTFAYSNLKMAESVPADGMIKVSCDVTNTGDRAGEEVVQVYVSDELASMIRPNKELAGFARIPLKAGETKRVQFSMKASQFAFLDKKMKWVLEAGKMTVRIGASSEDIRLTGSFEIEDTAYIEGKSRGFYADVTFPA